jgi:ribonucleoside-diphosphate reductase alpha chain
MDPAFRADISHHVWQTKYQYRPGGGARGDRTVSDTWQRVARALAGVEPEPDVWRPQFEQALQGFRFLPAGRILAGAGVDRQVTLFNCFVMGRVADSIDGIFDALKEGARTTQQGGGIGYDFSTLRPRGTQARHVGSIASGPVSFMRIWDSMCATMLSTGARRGAMMATLRCDHPDVHEFITAKQDPRELRHFNVSVQVTDDFMEAVRQDESWPLVFPEVDLDQRAPSGETVYRRWPGQPAPVPCRVLRHVRARELWERIMHCTYEYAEPGVLFVDRVNAMNNLSYREHITATNPCGEIPLPPYGACDLGSINLTQFVVNPFSSSARFDLEGLGAMAATATRMLDDVIDVSRYPLEAQSEQARGSRRIGLGVTGLADALIMMGVHYGQPRARTLAAEVTATICHAAYRASIGLARDKGVFPFYDREQYACSPFIRSLPEDIQKGIAQYGIRNSHLLAIAPTGTVSLLANNISSGIEPVFDFNFARNVLNTDGTTTRYHLRDYAYERWRAQWGDGSLPDFFIDARSLDPEAHLDMEAAIQPYVDNAISKTINVPREYDFAAFRRLYERAHEKGLKGCTTFRENPVTGSVLTSEQPGSHAGVHCCSPEREAD